MYRRTRKTKQLRAITGSRQPRHGNWFVFIFSSFMQQDKSRMHQVCMCGKEKKIVDRNRNTRGGGGEEEISSGG